MKSRGFALVTVLVIVILVPIVVFGTTFFITSSITRYDAQTRSMRALYLAQSGVHRAIFNIRSTGSLGSVANWDANNQIAVSQIPGCTNQLRSTGTAIAGGNSLSRTVYAQYSGNNIQVYMEGSSTVNPLPPCCDEMYWAFEEGAGTTTTSTGGLVASFVGSPRWVPWTTYNRKVGAHAILWNSANTAYYGQVPDAAPFRLTTSGTIMTWVNFNNVGTNRGLVHKGSAGNGSDTCYSLFLNNSRRISFMIASGTNASTRTTLTSNQQPPVNQWVHIAATWDALGMNLYYNGALLTSNSVANKTAQNTSAPLRFGTTSGASNRSALAMMDDVKIFSCAKTAAEILAYYNSTKNGPP